MPCECKECSSSVKSYSITIDSFAIVKSNGFNAISLLSGKSSIYVWISCLKVMLSSPFVDLPTQANVSYNNGICLNAEKHTVSTNTKPVAILPGKCFYVALRGFLP